MPKATVPLTIEALLKQCSLPRLEKEVLLTYILKKDRSYLFAYPEALLSIEQLDQFQLLADRHSLGEPIAYLTNSKEFMGLEFYVDSNVLIPRPDTELLVETALDLLKSIENPRVLELGTGSGCIPISLKHFMPALSIESWDLSEPALMIAKKNQKTLLGNEEISFLNKDMTDASNYPLNTYQLIVSNPPYISLSEQPDLSTSVNDFEPHSALFAKDHGLHFYKHLVQAASKSLTQGGQLAVEIGYQQKQQVLALFNQSEWKNVVALKDLSGLDRVVHATLR